MKKFTTILFILGLFFTTSSIHGHDLKISPDLSRNVIKRIQDKYIPMYKKYQGIESKRQVEIKTYDSKTNQLLHTSHVDIIRKDYFYKEPEVKVLKYIIDGKEEKPSEYKPIKYQPGYQVFDENGDKNYKTQVIGFKTIAGQHCYEVNVTPKETTKLHYKGTLYYRVGDLSLVYSSGTLGKISFPLKEFNMDLYTDHLNDLTVVLSGVIKARVDIPIIMPDRRIVSSFKVLNSRPIL